MGNDDRSCAWCAGPDGADLRHLDGLITAFRILGEADDSIEPVAVSSLARCAQDTLEEIERNWRTAIGAMREC
jgi:hypothetical protein